MVSNRGVVRAHLDGPGRRLTAPSTFVHDHPGKKSCIDCVNSQSLEQEWLSKSGIDGRQMGVMFGNFLGCKITAVKTDLAKCT